MYGQIPDQMSFNADFSSYTAGIAQLANTIYDLEVKALGYPGGMTGAHQANMLAEVLRKTTSTPVGPANMAGATQIRVIKVDEINITVPDSTAPQTPEDWRFITREYIVPELKRIGYA